MIKVVAVAAALFGVLIGAIASSAAIGAEVAGGVFVIGLLIIIADALQRMAGPAMPPLPSTKPDEDIVDESVEMVFNEDTGELVEVPAAPTTRRRRR